MRRKVSLIVSVLLNLFLLSPSTLAETDGGPSIIHQAGVLQKGPVTVKVLEAMKAQEM